MLRAPSTSDVRRCGAFRRRARHLPAAHEHRNREKGVRRLRVAAVAELFLAHEGDAAGAQVLLQLDFVLKPAAFEGKRQVGCEDNRCPPHGGAHPTSRRVISTSGP